MTENTRFKLLVLAYVLVAILCLKFGQWLGEQHEKQMKGRQQEVERIIGELHHQCGARFPLKGERFQACIECAMVRNDI